MGDEGYLNQQSIWGKPGGIAAGVTGFVLAKVAGLTALIPLAIGFAAYALLTKYSRMRPQLVPTVATSLAQVGWLALAVLTQPSLLGVAWLDIALVGALILWLA